MPMIPVPHEPPQIASLDDIAPKLRDRVNAVRADMRALSLPLVIQESLRTTERQTWLYRMGRDYDDGRGIVTNAATGFHSWHFFGLAVDVTSEAHGDSPPGIFWYQIGKLCTKHGLTWGGSWPRFTDRPHIQFGPPMRQSPSDESARLFATGGYEAVWRAVGAL